MLNLVPSMRALQGTDASLGLRGLPPQSGPAPASNRLLVRGTVAMLAVLAGHCLERQQGRALQMRSGPRRTATVWRRGTLRAPNTSHCCLTSGQSARIPLHAVTWLTRLNSYLDAPTRQGPPRAVGCDLVGLDKLDGWMDGWIYCDLEEVVHA